MSDHSPKGIKDYVRMDRVDIPLVITIVAAFVLGVTALIPYLPTGTYWPNDFAKLTEVIRNWALMFVGVFALWLAWRRIVLMDQQTAVALQDSKQKEMDHVAARFERAVELLNSKELHFKRYGAMTVVKIANEYPEDYRVDGIHLICTAVREIANINEIDRMPENLVHSMVKEMVAFVFTAGQETYDATGEKPPINLTGAFVRDLALEGATIFSDFIVGCEFDNVKFSQCVFIGSFYESTEFYEAEFERCNLLKAQFRRTSFFDSEFVYCSVNSTTWVACDFSGTKFNVLVMPEKRRCIFSDCNLTSAKFMYPFDGDDFQKQALPEVGRNKTNFVPRDFIRCTIGYTDAQPRGLEYNEPPLIMSVTKSKETERFDLTIEVDRREVVDADSAPSE